MFNKNFCIFALTLIVVPFLQSAHIKPGAQLWVDGFLAQRIGNNLSYIHPDRPNKPLPRGLGFKKSTGKKTITTPQKQKRRPVYPFEKGKQNIPYVWSDTFKGYVHWKGKKAVKYAPTAKAPINPSSAATAIKKKLESQWKKAAKPKPIKKKPTKKIVKKAAAKKLAAQKKIVAAQKKPVSKNLPKGMLDRDYLFDAVMGISETSFKNLFPRDQWGKPDRIQVTTWLQNNGIEIDDEWSVETLNDLRDQASKKIAAKDFSSPNSFGSLTLLIHNDKNPKVTDIRALHEKYPGAFFQIASNFNALEGGMGNFKANLSGMNHSPVQGEEATMATMFATIFRRYALDRINLLENLNTIFKISVRNTPLIQGLAAGKTLPITRKDMGPLLIGLHENILVTSGYNDDNKMIPRSASDPRLKPAYNKNLRTKNIRVNHIFVAAHNINQNQRKDIVINNTHKEIARAILRADYEGTLLTALVHDANVLVLTMLGANAFRNDAQWIAQALGDMVDLILASGIKVYLVVRHPMPAIQNTFLQDMQGVINTLENHKAGLVGDPNQIKKAVQNYLNV